MPPVYDNSPLRLGQSPLKDLAHRLARSVESGRRIQLSPSELDWFAVCGGLKAITDAATTEIIEKAKARLLDRGADLSFLEIRPEGDEQPADVVPANPPTVGAEPDGQTSNRPFTPATLAARWGVSPSTVHSRIKSGGLPHFRLGSMYRIRHQDVLEYERTHDVSGKPLPKM